MNKSIVFAKTGPELSEKLASRIAQLCKDLPKFTLGLSGGSLPKFLSKLNCLEQVDFSKWWVFFVDERKVKLDDPDSNYLGAKNAFLGESKIPKEQVFSINPELGLEECAKDYTNKIKEVLQDSAEYPSFDLLLLGIGPDGHICSLFPDHKLLESTKIIDCISDSPKPPSSRITFTLPMINNAKHVIFVCSGKEKAQIVKQIIHNEDQKLPAAKGREVFFCGLNPKDYTAASLS